MANDTLDYAAFVDAAMRGAVRDILHQVERSGLPGQHHFFISYRTDAQGVEMSDGLRARYPKEITIVLQHQFWDLKIEQEKFIVSLSFSNIPERLVVPFAALTGFADPSTKFGLKFSYAYADEPEVVSPDTMHPSSEEENNSVPPKEEGAKVIALDAFRKK